MKQKYKICIYIILFISFSFMISSFSFLLHTAAQSSSCPYYVAGTYQVDPHCYSIREVNEGYYQKIVPILTSSAILFFISLILLFVRREAFIAWAKFAGVAFPLMLGTLLYTFTHESIGAAWMSGPTNAQISATILPALFVIVSFVIIAFNQAKR